MNENPLDFWRARPHLPGAGKFDIGAHEFGSTGEAHIGLDLSTFPFEVPPFKLQFKAKPKRYRCGRPFANPTASDKMTMTWESRMPPRASLLACSSPRWRRRRGRARPDSRPCAISWQSGLTLHLSYIGLLRAAPRRGRAASADGLSRQYLADPQLRPRQGDRLARRHALFLRHEPPGPKPEPQRRRHPGRKRYRGFPTRSSMRPGSSRACSGTACRSSPASMISTPSSRSSRARASS